MQTEHLIANTLWESFGKAFDEIDGDNDRIPKLESIKRLKRLEDLVRFFGVDFRSMDNLR